ncbi:YbaB/EbfC family nucleoid-associated protein [Paractinoplanes globisporus]|uniref:YbaB/EbfC family nucleoid-associated protein n=1 Tax=Paractinoplanes globisporus TaxID=113565 RepID=A0ABW6WP17_9ACTN|nr:YbaB/EbfC family nucleoid-associated protein [Actinoplanes globisporus]
MPEVSDTQAFLDPDASREYLRSWKENVDRMAARAAAMSERMERLRVTARDGNGLAEVTIDSAGVLVGLELTDRIHRVEPAVVARAVMSALRDARAKAADRAHDIAVETMGPDSLSARTTADRMRQALERPDRAAADEDERGERGH